MTTEDLIALLQQHPKEQVGIAVHVGESIAWCAIDRVAITLNHQPRLMIHTEAEVKMDEDAIYNAVKNALLLKGEHGAHLL